MTSLQVLSLQLPPGTLGVNIQEAADGTCLIVSKIKDTSPFHVGDTVLSLNGTLFDLYKQAEWVNTIRASAQSGTRTVVVRRRHTIPANAPTEVHVRVASPKPKTKPAFTSPAISGSKNTRVSQNTQRFESGAKFTTSTGGAIETEAQKKFREMKEARAAGQREKEEEYCRARDEAERSEKETSARAKQVEAELLELEKQRANHGKALAKKKKATTSTTAPAAAPKIGEKAEEYRRSRDEAERSEKEILARAKQVEMELLELEQQRANHGKAWAKKEKANTSTTHKAEEKAAEHTSSVVVRLLDTAMAKVETLENELRIKNESHQALKDEMDGTKRDLGYVKGILEEKQRTNRETNSKLLAANEKVKALQKETVVWNDLNITLQQEYDILQLELDDIKNSDENSQEDLLQSDFTSDHLRKELFVTIETNTSLENQISLLEDDKQIAEKEREDEKRKYEGYKTLTVKLQDELKEQLSAIDSLVDLLERQKEDHNKELTDRNDEIALLKKQLAVNTSEKCGL